MSVYNGVPITKNPAIFSGRPIINGHRVTVHDIVVHQREGMAAQELAEAYNLTLEEVAAALSYYEEHRTTITRQIAADEREFTHKAVTEKSPVAERMRELRKTAKRPSARWWYLNTGALLAVIVATAAAGPGMPAAAAEGVLPSPVPCQVQFHESGYTCYPPSAAAMVENTPSFPTVDPSEAVRAHLRLTLSQVVVFEDTCIRQCRRSPAITFVFGDLHHGPAMPASSNPPFALVNESPSNTTHRRMDMDRATAQVTTQSGSGPAVTSIQHGPWTFFASLPKHGVTLGVEANAPRSVVKALGMELVQCLSHGSR
jgi:uncharacterized protein (DUF433 family)